MTKKKPAPKRSTALARRPPARPQTVALTIRSADRLPAPKTDIIESVALNTLGPLAATGALGLADVKLTEKEELVLNEQVLEAEVLMKPTGQPYLSHPSYTRWFNRAFGRLGWAIVPLSEPKRSGNSVVCPYMLYIHGHPAAFAMGEQEYHENNREQTYGDALEATVASALRRCAKRMGVGLELWDKRWLQSFIDRECVKVKCEVKMRDGGGNEIKWQWRRRSDPRFYNELKGQAAADAEATETQRVAPPRPPARKPEVSSTQQPVARPPASTPSLLTINESQVKRLWTIARGAGRKEDDVKRWLVRAYRIDSTKEILRDDYDTIVNVLEQPGPLPKGRVPGEEG